MNRPHPQCLFKQQAYCIPPGPPFIVRQPVDLCQQSSGQSETHSDRLRLEAQTAVPAWSFAAGLGRSAASWVPSSLGQNSTQHPLAGRIKKIQRRLWDLLPLMRKHVYHPAFGGSFSLKYVLPALVPEMTYAGMEVADGTDAGLAWESLIRGGSRASRSPCSRPSACSADRRSVRAEAGLVPAVPVYWCARPWHGYETSFLALPAIGRTGAAGKGRTTLGHRPGRAIRGRSVRLLSSCQRQHRQQ